MIRIRNNNWKRVLKIIIPYFLIVGLFQFIAYTLLGIPVSSEMLFERTSWQKAVVTFFTAIGTFVTVWLFRKFEDRKTFVSLGFSFFPKKFFLYGFLFGFMSIGIGFCILLLLKSIEYESFRFFVGDFMLSILAFGFVAFTEEVFVRGYVLNNLASSLNSWVALCISSVIFGIMHLANPNIGWVSFANLLLAGILIGLPYIYTKNLWFSIAFHFSWNFFQGTVFGFNVSGISGYSVISQKTNGNTIWNGGNFGFEGSITCIVIQIICIIILYFLFSRNREIQRSGCEISI